MTAPPDSADRLLDPAQGYRNFEALVLRAEQIVARLAPSLSGYSREAVSRRLVQQFVDVSVYPYIQAAAASHAVGAEIVPPFTRTVLLGGLRFRDDRIGVTPATWARNLGTFFVQWLRVIGYIAGTGHNSTPKRATLLMGVGLSDLVVDGSDTRFVDFCERGPVIPLCEATGLEVESAQSCVSSKPEWVSYSRHPLLALLRAHPPRGRDLLRFLGIHFATAASFVWHSLSRPLACILARDMAFHAPAVHLNRKKVLEAVVITSSYFHMQPLWMRSLPGRCFKVHMAWYSQNTRPFVYKPYGDRVNMPQYRHMAVDTHWVWTEGYACYLRELGTTAEVRVVGPILWYLPEASRPEKSALSVAVFDVTPVREGFAQKIGLPRNYYSTTNMIAFLEQSTAACERVAAQLGQPVLVLLKHKRGHRKVHDPRYIEFVDSMVAVGRIRLLPPQTSLYSLIGACSAVVVVPFSSPAYVASRLEVPAIYLDATDSIEATHEPASFVDFASSEAALATKLYAALEVHRQETVHA